MGSPHTKLGKTLTMELQILLIVRIGSSTCVHCIVMHGAKFSQTMSENGQFAPSNKAEEERQRHSHFSQKHGRPPIRSNILAHY